MHDGQQYKEISPRIYAQVKGKAWSIENREAHEASGRDIRYIGSRTTPDGLIFDYYQDSNKEFWFRNRFREPNGEIVSMEVHIFGHSKKGMHYGKQTHIRRA